MMAPEPSARETPVAGWYPDPENPEMARFWDGSQWTDERRPLDSKEDVSGWLLFFGYAGAIFLPIVGLIIGIALLVKKATGHGVAVLAISIAMFALGFAITAGEDGDAGRSGGRSVEERLQEITSSAERQTDRYIRCLEVHNGHDSRCKLHRSARR